VLPYPVELRRALRHHRRGGELRPYVPGEQIHEVLETPVGTAVAALLAIGAALLAAAFCAMARKSGRGRIV